MASWDNPAGRLHGLLSDFVHESQQGRNIQDTWRAVFEAESDTETLVSMAEAAALVPSIQQALVRVGEPGHLTQFYDYASAWVGAVIHPRRDLQGQPAVNFLPEKRALNTLDALSGFLSMVASEGPVPSQETVTDLHDQVLRLLSDVTDDTELPPELKREVLDHLQRLLNALLHFRLGGPDAVKTALDRLRVTVAFAPEEVKQTGTWKRVAAVGGGIWVVFTSSPVIAQAIESWGHLAQMLPPGGP